jgi:putative Holliday junction resolvase
VTRKPRLVLGFDYGRKRIGVAVGQALTGTATPLTTIRCPHERPDWQAIARLIETWHPDALVVGEPRAEPGAVHPIARAAKRFGNQLRGRYGLPVYWIDERLSSYAAERMLHDHGRRDEEAVDSMAAGIILETWLRQQGA